MNLRSALAPLRGSPCSKLHRASSHTEQGKGDEFFSLELGCNAGSGLRSLPLQWLWVSAANHSSSRSLFTTTLPIGLSTADPPPRTLSSFSVLGRSARNPRRPEPPRLCPPSERCQQVNFLWRTTTWNAIKASQVPTERGVLFLRGRNCRTRHE